MKEKINNHRDQRQNGRKKKQKIRELHKIKIINDIKKRS
jgi:hypothetical protein